MPEAEPDRFFARSPDMMISVSTRDGVLTRVNPAVTGILGWSAEELLGLCFTDLVHPDDRERTRTVTNCAFAWDATSPTAVSWRTSWPKRSTGRRSC